MDAAAGPLEDATLPGEDAAIMGINCTVLNRGCSCTMQNGPGSGSECSETSLAHALCCALDDWPGLAAECDCFPDFCGQDSPEVCSCSLGHAPSNQFTCEPSAGQHCCSSIVGCNCSTTPCAADQYQDEVAHCTAATQKCADGSHRVTSCSQVP